MTTNDFNTGCDAYRVGKYKTAFNNWKHSAEQGNAYAQVYLGTMYETGRGVIKNNEKAAKWYLKSAKQGNTMAQSNVSWLYENTKGKTQDYKKAFKWCYKAADQGDADMQYHLYQMYRNGTGTRKNNKEAVTWYRKATENDSIYCQVKFDSTWLMTHGSEDDRIWFWVWLYNQGLTAESDMSYMSLLWDGYDDTVHDDGEYVMLLETELLRSLIIDRQEQGWGFDALEARNDEWSRMTDRVDDLEFSVNTWSHMRNKYNLRYTDKNMSGYGWHSDVRWYIQQINSCNKRLEVNHCEVDKMIDHCLTRYRVEGNCDYDPKSFNPQFYWDEDLSDFKS